MNGDAWGNSAETFPATCDGCARPTLIEVAAEWDAYPVDANDLMEPHRWTVGRCSVCNQPSLHVADEEHVEGRASWGSRHVVWPKQARSLSRAVPLDVRETYDEAQRCMTVRSYTGAVLLARRMSLTPGSWTRGVITRRLAA